MDPGAASDFQELIDAAREDVVSLADNLNAIGRVARSPAPPNGEGLARRLYRDRRVRERYFDGRLFAEPAWDMLLDLYAARAEGRILSTKSACIGAAVPPTTALRWLLRLEQAGLITRSHPARDERLTLVEISDETFDRMSGYLKRIGG